MLWGFGILFLCRWAFVFALLMLFLALLSLSEFEIILYVE